MRSFVSRNPYTQQVLKEYPFMSDSALHEAIEKSWESFEFTRKSGTLKSRAERVNKVANLLDANVEKYAKLMTMEMGKTITATMAEVKRCSVHCRHYVDNLEKYYRSDRVKIDGVKKALVEYHPAGVIHHISPFNFPFWLCFKGFVPSLLLGNSYLLRPSDSTPLSGVAIEELFKEAGFDSGEVINVFTSHEQAEKVLASPRVRGLNFTGSSRAGGILGSIAGKYCKKAVMELGGSDGFLVLKDADIENATNLAITGRLQNAGQVCIAAKRFIIHQDVYEKFRDLLLKKVHDVKIGDPMKPETQMGPLSRADLVDTIHAQVQKAVKGGGNLLYGGHRLEGAQYGKGNFYAPTIIEMDEHNPISQEETFGPVFSLYKAKDDADIVRLANNTPYGLGCIINSRDTDHAEKVGQHVEVGMLFINDITKSDSSLPFGGFKYSGYGRDLGHHGVSEFANIKTVWVK